MGWKPAEHTDDENARWAMLRSLEWSDFPTFLAPLYGPLVVLFLGWTPFLLVLVALWLLWRLFVVDSFVNITLSSTAAMLVSTLQWPMAIGAGVVAYALAGHSIIFALSLAAFPILYLPASLILMPLEKQLAQPVGVYEERFILKMGYRL